MKTKYIVTLKVIFRLLKPLLYLLAGIIILASLLLTKYFLEQLFYPKKTVFAATFSTLYSKELGLVPQDVFEASIQDLGLKQVRIPVYWSQVEISPREYDFSEVDAILDIAAKNDVKVILAIGYKVPRWPECHAPKRLQNLENKAFSGEIYFYLTQLVNHFNHRSEIVAWQVENEPFVMFGECRNISFEQVQEEIQLVRSLSDKKVVISDTGELSVWLKSMLLTDQMGYSLYRYGWYPLWGYKTYPLPPLFYPIKTDFILALLLGRPQYPYIAELQAEPWTPGTPIPETPMEDLVTLFSIKHFQDNIEFANQTRADLAYLWGLEWWYWMKLQGHLEYWEYAKELF